MKSHKNDIFKMLDFFIYNIFVQCRGRVFQKTVGILMGKHCAHLIADLFIHTYETDFISDLIRKKKSFS